MKECRVSSIPVSLGSPRIGSDRPSAASEGDRADLRLPNLMLDLPATASRRPSRQLVALNTQVTTRRRDKRPRLDVIGSCAAKRGYCGRNIRIPTPRVAAAGR